LYLKTSVAQKYQKQSQHFSVPDSCEICKGRLTSHPQITHTRSLECALYPIHPFLESFSLVAKSTNKLITVCLNSSPHVFGSHTPMSHTPVNRA